MLSTNLRSMGSAIPFTKKVNTCIGYVFSLWGTEEKYNAYTVMVIPKFELGCSKNMKCCADSVEPRLSDKGQVYLHLQLDDIHLFEKQKQNPKGKSIGGGMETWRAVSGSKLMGTSGPFAKAQSAV